METEEEETDSVSGAEKERESEGGEEKKGKGGERTVPHSLRSKEGGRGNPDCSLSLISVFLLVVPICFLSHPPHKELKRHRKNSKGSLSTTFLLHFGLGRKIKEVRKFDVLHVLPAVDNLRTVTIEKQGKGLEESIVRKSSFSFSREMRRHQVSLISTARS